MIRNGEDKRRRLRSLAKNFRRRLVETGWESNDFDSPIIPIVIGDESETLKLRDRLLENGILVGAVRPPTVPRGTSRLRVSLHSEVTESQLDEFFEVLRQWKSR